MTKRDSPFSSFLGVMQENDEKGLSLFVIRMMIAGDP